MPFLLPAAASAVAAAAPAAAAAGAASAGIGATLTSIAGNVLMNVAISAAMSIFQPQVGVAGRTFEWTLDPDGPIPFAAGRIGVPGSAVYRKTFGPDLMYYGIPSVISGAGPIDGYEAFLADDESVTFDGSGKAVTSQYAGELWYKNKPGTQPDTALTSPTGLKNGATLPGWTSAHKLSGKACYMIVMGENSKGTAFPTGEIKPLITLRGLKVYDPRLDSTYPGGSGAHRLANPATWTYSANPILWALKWTLGLWEGPNGKGAPQVDYQVGGIGAKLSGIDVPAFVAAANVADANGWTCAAYPTTDDDKHQVLTGFLQAGGAIYAQRAGKISCIQRAAPRTSIVTVSAYDTAGPLEIDTAASRIDRINTLRPRFWSEPHRWQMTALDQEVTAQAYRDEDGGVRPAGIDYPYVTDAVQAAQLAALQIANTREGIAGVVPLKPHLQRIRPGDAFTITEAGFVLNGLKCLCLNTDYDPATGVVRVSFVSETDAKYPFALGQDPTPPTPQVLTPVDPRFVSPPDAGDWTVTPRPPSQGGAQQPGFDLTGFVSNSTATAIIVETGPNANGPWTQAYQGPPTVTNIPIDGLQPGATYFIAIQYQRNQNYSEREVFGPFTAPELVAGDVSTTAPTIVAMQDAIDLAEEGIGSINTAVASLNATVYTAGTGLKARSDAMFASLNTPTTGVLARLTATETAVSTNNSAAVERLNALEATVNTAGTGLTARLATAESAITANNNAATSRLSALEATVNTAGTGLSARVAGLQTAVSDLNTGKANASDLTALQTEVTTARGGAASLNTRLNTVESTVAGKASASSVSALEATVGAPGTGLLARTGAAENAIVSLQSGKADASRVTLVEASAAAALNGSALNKNSTFAVWPAGQALPSNIVAFGSGLTVTKVAGRVSPNAPQLEVASGVSNAGIEFTSPEANWNGPLPTANGQTSYWAIDYKIEVGTPDLGSSALRFMLTNRATGATVSDVIVRRLYELHTSTGDDQIVEGSFLVACSPTVAAPAYSARLAFFARTDPIAGYGRYIPDRVAVRPALPSEIASGVTLPSVTARVGVLETATTNLQTQKADASRVTSLEATINTPGTGVSARLTTVESVAASADGRAKAIKGVVLDVNGYVSGHSSTNDGTSAAFEVSADKFGIRAPGSGERTEYRAGNWYVYSPSENTRTRYGKAFGGDQKLVWWTGPTSVAEGSETKGNAYVYMSQNTVGGSRFGGSDVIGPGGTLTATANTGFIGGGRSGAGYVNTSNQVTVTVSGGTSGATIRWTRISGDSRIQMNNAAAFTTGAYATIGAGEVISAYFMGSITKGGQSAVVYVQVDLSDNGT